MNKMDVSIILPIYNVEEYLSQCLDSFIKTLPESCEVILVNDGSTDGSLQICEQYQKLYPALIKILNKENGGLSDARNAGTEVAQGEYVYYLDSDDWITPDAISKLYQFALMNKCEIVQGGFYYAYQKFLLYDNTWHNETEAPFLLSRTEAMHQLIKQDYIKNFAWGKLYRADIAKKYSFPKGTFYEDSYWQHLVINEVTNYGVIPEPMYFYRQREDSISGNFSVRLLDLLSGYRERKEFIDANYPQYSEIMHKLYHDLCISFMEGAIRSGNPEVIKAFKDNLINEGIRYNHVLYQIEYFFKRIKGRLLPDHLKRIEFNEK